MKKTLISTLLLMAACLHAAPPVVSNVTASQRTGTKFVDIYYDVSASTSSLYVTAQVSSDGGLTFTIPAATFTGAIGSGVAPGTGRHIVWNAGADWNGQWVSGCKVRVNANDGTTPVAPAGMAYIPPGPFQMGDNLDAIGDALLLHNVQVSGFFMDINLVSGALWQVVQYWANGNGYTISAGSWYAYSHPVQSITWYDAVKWCNARSQKEGLTPVYYTDDAKTVVYRTGNSDVTNARVKWGANGYRLPTEAEWEKAARGALLGQRYPWGNTIAGNQANYYGSGDPYESSYPATTPCGYYNGGQSPAGANMANGYGLYDMAGNVWQWCWDWYGGSYYADSSATNDPRGPTTSSNGARLLRGGAWKSYSTDYLHCACRSYVGSPYPSTADYCLGFRCARGL